MRDLAMNMARWIEANEARVAILAHEVQKLNNQLHQRAQNKSNDHWLPSTARVLTKDDQLALIRAKEEATKAKSAKKKGSRGGKAKQTASKENGRTSARVHNDSEAEDFTMQPDSDDSDQSDNDTTRQNDQDDYAPQASGSRQAEAPLRRSTRRRGITNTSETSNMESSATETVTGSAPEGVEASAIPAVTPTTTRRSVWFAGK